MGEYHNADETNVALLEIYRVVRLLTVAGKPDYDQQGTHKNIEFEEAFEEIEKAAFKNFDDTRP